MHMVAIFLVQTYWNKIRDMNRRSITFQKLNTLSIIGSYKLLLYTLLIQYKL